MYSTSDEYKEQIYLGKECLLKIYIDGNLINDDDIYSFKVTHNLFDSSKVSLGSTTSKSIELEINQKALPETYSNFYIETGLRINGEDEIVPIGYFTLEDITKDEDVASITAVDYMMKFEKNISDSVTGTALEVLQAICDICGVKLATTDFMGNDTEISITNTMTARQVIGYIAELAGGFACIGRDGKLYIKSIGKNTTEIDIELFGDYFWGEKFVCNEVDFISDIYDYEISDTDFSSAYLDCILDSPLYDNELEGQPLKLNSNNPFITNEEQVQSIYNKLACLELNSFTGQVLIDPALDIGDIIYIDNKPIIYQGDMEYLGYFKGNITSTIETEEKSNTTVQTISLASKLKQVTSKVEEVTEKVSEVETNVENKVNTDKIISAINKSEEEIQIQAEKVSLFGKELDLTGDNITIKSKNFSVDENGSARMNDATITGGKIELRDDMTSSDPQLIISGGDTNSSYGSAIMSSYELSNTHYEYEEQTGDWTVGYTTTNEGAVRGSEIYVSSRCTGYRNDTGDIYDLGENTVFIKTIKTEEDDEASISIEHDGSKVFLADENGNVSLLKSLQIPQKATQGYGICNSDGTSIIRDHGNSNITVDATGGDLYLGWQNTSAINFLNGKILMDSDGKFTYSTAGLYSPHSSGIYFDQYGNIHTQKSMTTGQWKIYNGDIILFRINFSDNSIKCTNNIYASNIKSMDCGEVSITPSAANTPTGKAVTFSTSFSSSPKVVTTAKSTVPGTTVLGTGVAGISKDKCTVYVTRTTTSATTIEWIAMQ